MRFSLISLARLLLLTGAGLCGPTFPCRAAPSQSSVAQALFDEAKALMGRGDFATACPKLEESQRIDPQLGTLLNLADCREKEGNVATAWSIFRDAESLAHHAGQREAEEVARSRAAALLPRLPRLLLRVDPEQSPNLSIQRNDVEVGAGQWGSPIPLDPGRYELVASAPGYITFHSSVRLEVGGGTVTIRIPPLIAGDESVRIPQTAARAHETVVGSAAAKPHTPSSRSVPTATWLLGGSGVLAIGGALALGAWAKSQYSSANCPEHVCATNSDLELRESARTKATISTVVFAVGATAFVGSVTWWLVQPRVAHATGPTPSLRLEARLGSAGLAGAW